MSAVSVPLLLIALLWLIALIAFSSGTEVAMLSVNRYRIRHRAQAGQGTAKLLERLLRKPEEWLGANLVIVAAANVFASAIATLLAERTGYRYAVPVTGVLLTLVVIVFGELTPKIYAAAHPETSALRAARIYRVLVFLARPFLTVTNGISYGLLRAVGVVRTSPAGQTLSTEELRTAVAEAGPMIPARHRQMLLSVLDLGQITVNDIMIPRQEIAGIDLAQSWDDVLAQLERTPHTRVPVFDGELDNLVGVLHMKRIAHELVRGALTRERLEEMARAREPYFIPEGTSLNVQLAHFQRNRRRLAFVVNEYGDIEGLVTLEDILEEIVGEFTSDPATISHRDIYAERPGIYIINGGATLRAVNRALQWQLPTDGPKTVNGLLIERLETIPAPGTTLKVGPYLFEVLQIADNAIKTVRVHAPPMPPAPSP